MRATGPTAGDSEQRVTDDGETVYPSFDWHGFMEDGTRDERCPVCEAAFCAEFTKHRIGRKVTPRGENDGALIAGHAVECRKLPRR